MFLRDLLCNYKLYNTIILPTDYPTGVNVRVPNSWQLRLLHTSSRSPYPKQGSVHFLEPDGLNQNSAHYPGHSYSEPCLAVPYKLHHTSTWWYNDFCKTCSIGYHHLRSSTMTVSLFCVSPISSALLMGKSLSFLTWHKSYFTVSFAYLWCSSSYHSYLISFIWGILNHLLIICAFLPSDLYSCSSFPCPASSFLPLPLPHNSCPS